MPTEQADGRDMFQPVHISTSTSWTWPAVCSSAT